MTILFDLDGTIINPREGITSSMRMALEKMNRPSTENLDWCIGPPIHETMATLLKTSDKDIINQAVSFYRETYSAGGLFKCHLYTGIPECLSTLVDRGFRLYVATSKPTVFAQRIIDHFSLGPLFSEVYGSELDGTRSDKGELIKFILDEEKIDIHKCHMVGDRKFDILGAKKNSIFSVGILWGYGDKEELENESPNFIVDSTEQLTNIFVKQIKP